MFSKHLGFAIELLSAFCHKGRSMDRAQPVRILVIRGGAIGDFILTLPVLAALRAHFPQCRLDVLGYPHIIALARMGGLAKELRSIESRALAGFFVPNGLLDPELHQYFASFQIIISYLYDPDGMLQNNVRLCTRGQFIQGAHRPDEAAGLHATEVFLKALERLAIFEADPVPRLALGQAGTPASLAGAARTLVCHPGSGSERKNWPESAWAGFLTKLVTESDWRILLAGGEAEGQRLERLARLIPGDRLELARSLPLTTLAERIRVCQFFIGHDSGISHLCAALGLPGLVLWAETNETIWRPRQEQVVTFRHPQGIQQIEVTEVFSRLP
jgi:heptosyltransferase III